MEVVVEERIGEAIDAKNAAVVRALEAVGLFVEGEAKIELEADPRRIDTGLLRNSITHATAADEEAVYIGTNVEYAKWVHEGTRRMEANRFLKNAVQNNLTQIKTHVENELKG